MAADTIILLGEDSHCFGSELAAIRADVQLQVQMLAGMWPGLQRFIGMDIDAVCTATSTSGFTAACRVLGAFGNPCMERGLREMGHTEPAVLKTLPAAVECLLRFPAETVPYGVTDRVEAISAAFRAAQSIITAECDQRPDAEAVAEGLLACVRQAAALARLELLRIPNLDMASLVQTLKPMTGLGIIFPTLGCSLEAGTYRPPPDSPLGPALSAQLVSALKASEACIRLCTELSRALRQVERPAEPHDIVYLFALQALTLKATDGMMTYVPTEVLLSEEALSAVSGLANSFVKFGLQLAMPSADGTISHPTEFIPLAMASHCLANIFCQVSDLMFVDASGVEPAIVNQRQECLLKLQAPAAWMLML